MIDDPCDDWGENIFIRWMPTQVSRTRPTHSTKALDISMTEWPEVEPPRYDLGRFNCRGEYVLPRDLYQ